MATPTIWGAALDLIEQQLQANGPAILAELSSQNTNISTAIETFLLNIVAKNPFLSGILGGMIKGLGPQIVAALGSEEAAALAWVEAELKALAAAQGG
jgi:hypothetical protein